MGVKCWHPAGLRVGISCPSLTNVVLNNSKNPLAIRHTFKAYERLKRKQHIDTLFRSGKAFSVFPVKFLYRIIPRIATENSPVRVGFAVSKKRFRSSVHRHRVRRLMSEAWRLGKHQIYSMVPPEAQFELFLIYLGKELPEPDLCHQAIERGIARLKEEALPSS